MLERKIVPMQSYQTAVLATQRPSVSKVTTEKLFTMACNTLEKPVTENCTAHLSRMVR